MPKKVVCQRVKEIDIEDLKNGDLFTTIDLDGNKKSYIQVNGKLRGTFMTAKDTAKEEMEAKALALPSVQNHTNGKTIKKIIVVPNKIVNIVAI